MNKIFAIGDIHGCLNKLRLLMREMAPDPSSDTLIFIGDYIDRDEGSKDVVDYVLQLEKSYRQVIFLCGNHESMFLKYLEGEDEEMYLFNGGIMTLKAYGILPSDGPRERKAKIPAEHLRFFESLLPYYETERYVFVHAGLVPGKPLSRQSAYDMQWVRQEFIDSDYDFGKLVVFGHTRLSEPLIAANKIGIDTGAVYGGRLTGLELPALKFYQV